MHLTSFELPEEVNEELESRLSYGDTKGQWIRRAVELRMDFEDIVDGHDNYEDLDELLEALREESCVGEA